MARRERLPASARMVMTLGLEQLKRSDSAGYRLQWTIGTSPTVRIRATNNTGTAATLYGWIDYNQDGVFDNNTERASASVPAGSLNSLFTVIFPEVPSDAATGTTYARFRLSSDGSRSRLHRPGSRR